MPANTAFALSVAGAAYETDGEKFSNEMLVEKRVFLIKEFNLAGSSFEDQFATLQSLLLYQLIGIFHKEQSRESTSPFPAPRAPRRRFLRIGANSLSLP